MAGLDTLGKRLRQILEGERPGRVPYHLLWLAPSEVAAEGLASELFGGGPGTIVGPHRAGELWAVSACLEVREEQAPTAEDVAAILRATSGSDPRVVAEWVERRAAEGNLVIDDEALDALAPGG